MGRSEGRDAGREEGLKEGLKEGRNEQAREIARNMLALGLNSVTIERVTGLNGEELAVLADLPADR
ncbi:hypothetical protein [Sodalis sp. dw_96]|uniref:hypothetical protein n=1 Tax=Sodalis sp. dw_96 TaxID=2719794 RepID=UPI001BD6978A|nr:hypothetical protein [Sodalis sp. dw_96]